MEAYLQVACFNCEKAGCCDNKGTFDPNEDLIPCYSFVPNSAVLTSAIRSARSGVYQGIEDGKTE